MAKTLFGDKMGGAGGFKIPVNLNALASGATNTAQDVIAPFVAPHDMKLRAAFISFLAAFTGQATNYQTFSIINKGTDGSGTTVMASLAASSTAVSGGAGVRVALTLSTTAADLLISEGEQISCKVAATSNGQVYPIVYPSAHFSLQ